MSRTLRAHLTSALSPHGPVLLVVAGSNGAGKTSFFRRYLENTGLPFINADEIARLLSPKDPESAAWRAMFQADRLRHRLVAERQSFCMETVMSDSQGSKLRFLEKVRAGGYRLVFVWIRIESANLSAARVSSRVSQGGHNVPARLLRDRFPRTQVNARKALKIAHLGLVIDNSSFDLPYRLVETWIDGKPVELA